MQSGRIESPVEIKAVYERLRASVCEVIVGKDRVVELCLIALFAGGHVLSLSVRELELLLEDEGEEQVEGALEGVEVERELCDGAHRANSMVSGGRGLSARSSSGPGAARSAAGVPRPPAGAATR